MISRGLFVLDIWNTPPSIHPDACVEHVGGQCGTATGPTGVEKATFFGRLPAHDRMSPLLIKIELLLERAHFSPGPKNRLYGTRGLTWQAPRP